jgi:glutamyl-tRNA synthetase
MTNLPVRVRFAPAPTGMMHLGNVRTALLNYLFAQQKQGTYILRIEDTDADRNYDPHAKEIMADLAWLGLTFDEGPAKGGPYAPYFQSQRHDIYQRELNALINMNAVYKCYCTADELELKRQRQIALKQPPRYDRTCLKLTPQQKEEYTARPFIWRIQLDITTAVTIYDLAHGNITFELKNFSDFPLTRQDGTFTFIFANFVDDMLMEITHVFRGEDHLTNTALQATLYALFKRPLPIFFHMPILCNKEGKKLSKRDFGFSLRDLQKEGYLPQAIDNYLAIIGSSFNEEIMDLQSLVQTFAFDKIQTTGHIKYDVEKLQWLNHKWINKIPTTELSDLVIPYLRIAYPNNTTLDHKKITALLEILKKEMVTLTDSVHLFKFIIEQPALNAENMTCISPEYRIVIAKIVGESLETISSAPEYVQTLKNAAQQSGVPIKELFSFLRLALMGDVKGPGIHELIAMLGIQESTVRITQALQLL